MYASRASHIWHFCDSCELYRYQVQLRLAINNKRYSYHKPLAASRRQPRLSTAPRSPDENIPFGGTHSIAWFRNDNLLAQWLPMFTIPHERGIVYGMSHIITQSTTKTSRFLIAMTLFNWSNSIGSSVVQHNSPKKHQIEASTQNGYIQSDRTWPVGLAVDSVAAQKEGETSSTSAADVRDCSSGASRQNTRTVWSAAQLLPEYQAINYGYE